MNKYWRKCSQVVRTLALRSGIPGLKSRSDHSLSLFPVVPGSTCQPYLYIANWFACGQLRYLTVVVVVVVLYRFVDCVSLALKSLYGEWFKIKYVLYCIYI